MPTNPSTPLNVLSLFSGIGGLELGLERAGMNVVGQVEIDSTCLEILNRHWPAVPKWRDVRTAAEWWTNSERPDVDLICGGFPCQDISSANTKGSRSGLAGSKSGLWSAFADIVGAIRPRWVVVENSPNWRAWSPQVRSDLAALSFESVACLLPAGAFGAPHRRPRVWVVANSDGEGESLRAIHAEVARFSPLPGRSNYVPDAFALGTDDGLPGRMDRLRALGNSVAPQVAEYVGRLIMNQAKAVAA